MKDNKIELMSKGLFFRTHINFAGMANMHQNFSDGVNFPPLFLCGVAKHLSQMWQCRPPH